MQRTKRTHRKVKPRKSRHPEQHYDLLGHDTNDITNCQRKVRHASKQRAKEKARLARREGLRLYVYQCVVCKGYHLSRKDPATARRLRRGWKPTPTIEKEIMTDNTDKYATIAKASGYIPADELGQDADVLDLLCKEHDLTPMVLGDLKFYPAEEIQAQISAHAVPEGMVAAIDWSREHGVDRNRIPNAIRNKQYTGRSHYGKALGVAGRSRYYIVPEEAAAYCEANKRAEKKPSQEPAPAPWANVPASGSWITLEEAYRVTGVMKSEVREMGDNETIRSKVEAGVYLVLWDDLDAFLRPRPRTVDMSVPPGLASAPTSASVEIGAEVLQLVREANARQRELHTKMLALMDEVTKLVSTGPATWRKTIAERDVDTARGIAEAVASALDEFERKKASPAVFVRPRAAS